MKILNIALFLGLCSVAAVADTLPDGTYKGTGLWKTASTSANYHITTTIEGQIVKSLYQWTEDSGRRREFGFDLKLQPGQGNFVDVYVDGGRPNVWIKAGEGYCLDHTSLCHYEIEFGESGQAELYKVEETLTVQDGKLYRFGHKNFHEQLGTPVLWQDQSHRQ